MIAYVDSSVLLRIVLGEKRRLPEWNAIESAVSSSLLEVECLRTLDRMRRRSVLGDEELAARRSAVLRVVEGFELVELARPILARAAQPFPTPLGTLDAIHLTSALAWRDRVQAGLVMATHDGALAVAARAFGLEVVGA